MKHISRLLLAALLIISTLPLLSFIYVALSRMGYPYALEWMEGGTLGHVRRVLAGQPLYIQPSLQFTPFIYTPFYYYLSAPLMTLLGEGFTPLRLVSFLSTLGSMGVLFLLLKQETKRWIFGALSAGLFAATFRMGGAWFDLARSDSLSLFLLLLSACMLRRRGDSRNAAVAALVMFLSFFSKQTALASALAMSLFSLVTIKGRARWVFPSLFLALAAGNTLVMNRLSGGWYSYYIFDLPNQHTLHVDMLPSILLDDLAKPLAVALILNGIFFISLLVKRRWRSLMYYGMLSGSLIGASILSRMHSGGYVNVLIPAYAAVAAGFGMGLDVILTLVAERRARSVRPLPLLGVTLVQILALGACAAQFGMLFNDPRVHIPTHDDRQAGDALVGSIAAIEGEVYIPYHGYLAELAGKAPTAQGMALEDVFRSRDEAISNGLKTEIRRAIEERRFAAIILDGQWRFAAEIEENYQLAGDLFDNDVFWTYTGMITRPNLLYLRRGD